MKKSISIIALLAAFALVTAAGAASPTLTLAASTKIVVYGGTTNLAGVLSTKKTGQNVSIQAQECGKPNFANIADAKTTTGGAFSFAAKPIVNTTYRAKLKGATSPTVAVAVKPVLRLKKLRSARYRATLTAGLSFAGKYVDFQRRSGGTWKTINRITFKTGQASGPAPTTVSTGTKRIRLKHRIKVRLLLVQAQAGCYTSTASNTTRS